MSEAARPKTPDLVRQEIDKLEMWLSFAEKRESAVIGDYPIGRQARGYCKLEVEHSPTKGYRTVRTTTNKHGRWCAPKKSTYRTYTCVIRHPHMRHNALWLCFSAQGVYVNYANGEPATIAQAPHYCEPRRQEQKYKVSSQTYSMGAGTAGLGLQPQGDAVETEHAIPADRPELCDAYDLWKQELQRVLTAWKARPAVPSEPAA